MESWADLAIDDHRVLEMLLAMPTRANTCALDPRVIARHLEHFRFGVARTLADSRMIFIWALGLALLLAAYSSRVYRDAKLLRPSRGRST